MRGIQIKKLEDNMYVIDEEIYDVLSESNKVYFKSNLIDEEFSYEKLLDEFSTNKLKLKYLKEMIDSDYTCIKHVVRIGENYYLVDKISISNLATYLKDSVYESLKLKNVNIKNHKIKFNIDGKETCVDSDDIINLLLKEDYDFIIKKYQNKGISECQLIYMFKKYFELRILPKYILDEKQIKKYLYLIDINRVDYESINTFQTIDDIYNSSYAINVIFKKYIVNNMKDSYSDIEKSLYVYYKLCSVLTYSKEYFIKAKEGNLFNRKNSNQLCNISLDNPEVVCVEMNMLFAKILSDFGFKYEIVKGQFFDGNIGSNHQSLNYRSGKFLIHADAFTSILNGDFVNMKIGKNSNGIICLNKNQDTVNEFEEIKKKIQRDVYNEFISERNANNSLIFYNCIHNRNNPCVNLRERIMLIFNSICKMKYRMVDALGYIINIKEILFTKDELKDNIQINILKYQNNNIIEPIVLFTVNEENINKIQGNVYIIFDSNNNLYEISIEQLENYFKSGKIKYITEIDKDIPGISRGLKL